MFKDKLNRRIDVGDIVACADAYGSNIYIGKIERITFKTVTAILYSGRTPEGYNNISSVLSMNTLKEEPTGWIRRTSSPERMFLILKKKQ